jgi:hypothetical protein
MTYFDILANACINSLYGRVIAIGQLCPSCLSFLITINAAKKPVTAIFQHTCRVANDYNCRVYKAFYQKAYHEIPSSSVQILLTLNFYKKIFPRAHC